MVPLPAFPLKEFDLHVNYHCSHYSFQFPIGTPSLKTVLFPHHSETISSEDVCSLVSRPLVVSLQAYYSPTAPGPGWAAGAPLPAAAEDQTAPGCFTTRDTCQAQGRVRLPRRERSCPRTLTSSSFSSQNNLIVPPLDSTVSHGFSQRRINAPFQEKSLRMKG